jgi:hypothetical protein
VLRIVGRVIVSADEGAIALLMANLRLSRVYRLYAVYVEALELTQIGEC